MPLFKVAIVGAGPAGYFAAQALHNQQNENRTFAIDMIERLPTPWGLVRSGVAPDHPKIKTVSKTFEKIAADPNFRLFANVEIGSEISVAQLKEKYDAVVIATGSALGKKLGIPGEDLPGSLSAADFVPWYNAHPDYVDVNVPLDCDTAVVIGAGNVAMDVARMLALEPSELDPTDTADHAIDAFKASAVRNVYISARRGPEHAAFTSPELRELPKLEHTNVVINKEDIDAALVRAGAEPEKDVKSNLDAMLLIAQSQKSEHERTMHFLFQHTPKQILGTDRVEGVVYSTPHGDVTIKCGLVITAIGYQAAGIEGVPYENGKVVNTNGRVNENLYVVGWAKRGPSGVIGTNKSDAAAVVELMISDLKTPKANGDISQLLTHQVVVDQSAWQKINEAEVAAGEPKGKPRVKSVKREELLKLGLA
ncbi:MAG: glutamate synthase subunit beta [Actinobacteria bacterium]|nr:glutamate synthase subunit beta [Actinomycetota bacterium]NCV42332.1 glutamate synthase subunit beta [Actinomycetota bacterium]NCW92637.1 glutamate synthase subunit beta [Actinomycetota bacterium]NCX16229.1 glutamate synthase subunit beta [Actinomycetota bacterium]NDA45462.1 glutamate synthase subunit beta [Actinomycetota bacterium]